MSRGALLSIGLLAFLASCPGTTDDENGGTTQPSFTYSSGVTAEFGMAQDAVSSAPTWTNLPAGAVTYSIEGPPDGSNLNVEPAVGNDGAVTVPKDAHAATEDWTVTAAAGGSAYTAKITITVNPKEHTIGTVSYTAITASKDVEITPVRPSFTDALPSGAAAVYTVAPALPAGMDLDPATGEITGTPAAEQAETEHTVTLTLTGNYSGTATASITVTVTADARAPWVESLDYNEKPALVSKGGAVAGAVTIPSPTLTQMTGVPSSITAVYSSVENRVAVDSSTGEITISDGTDLSDIDGDVFTFNVQVRDNGGTYATFQKTVTVNLRKVKSITFGTPPSLTYGDAPRMLTAPAVDVANGADTTVTYSTSDAAIADVDSGTGELTIAAAGVVTITATSTFDTSVKGEQTLTIAQKNINDLTNLTFGDLTVYVGIEFSGAITVVSGLIGSDTMAEALSFVPIPTGPVQVDEDGALTIPVQNNTNNHGTVHDITVNGTGNYTGSKDIQVTLKVIEELVYNLGDTGPAGGKIFYVNPDADSDGWTYLEAAPSDFPDSYKWGNTTTEVGKTGTAIGTGESNTAAIVAAMVTAGFTDDYAAKACADSTLGGKDDWFLPSKDELNELYNKIYYVGSGGFRHGAYYWSSSEASSDKASIQEVYDPGPGTQLDFGKDIGGIYVRAVRAF